MDIVLGKIGAEIASQTTGGSAGGAAKGASFQDVMTTMDNSSPADLTSSLGLDQSDLSSSLGDFKTMAADGITMDPNQLQSTGVSNISSSTDKVVDMLSGVNKSQMQMDNLLNDVLYSGKKFSNQELLVIQAQIHQFTELTELTVKVAEQGVNALKSVLSTQV